MAENAESEMERPAAYPFISAGIAGFTGISEIPQTHVADLRQ